MKKMMEKRLFTALLFLLLIPLQIFAICKGPIVPCGHSGLPACGLCHLFALINNIFTFFFSCILPIVGGALLVWGGFYFVISGANPDELKKAKGIIQGAVTGLVIIFVAWIFLNSFLTAIGVSKWTGFMDDPSTPEVEGWWHVECE